MTEVAELKARHFDYRNGACDCLYPYMLCA